MTGTDPIALIGQLAENLAVAERSGRKLSMATLLSEGLVPETIEAGMAVQAATTKILGKEVGGWKVAINVAGTAIAAPILETYLCDNDANGEIRKPGAKAIELELCFRLRQDIPPLPAGAYSREDVLETIGSIHLGAELIDYRIDRQNDLPFPLFLADRLGNHSYVIGPEVQRELVDLLAFKNATPPSLSLDDNTIELFSGFARHPQRDPLSPLVAFVNSRNNNLVGFKNGQFITTGSLCGVSPVRSGSRLRISGKNFPKMSVSIF